MEWKGSLSPTLDPRPPLLFPLRPVSWAQRYFLHTSEYAYIRFTRVAALPAFFPLAMCLRDAPNDLVWSCPFFCTAAEQSVVWMNIGCEPALPTTLPLLLPAPKHSWPLPGPWEGRWNSSSSHYFHSDDECGICLPSCCPTRLGHTTEKCVRLKAPAPGQMLSKESQKAGWKGEEFIYQVPKGRRLRAESCQSEHHCPPLLRTGISFSRMSPGMGLLGCRICKIMPSCSPNLLYKLTPPKISVKEFSLFHISDHIWICPAF